MTTPTTTGPTTRTASERVLDARTGMDAVTLVVSDLEGMTGYYARGLGVEPIEERSRGTEVHRVLGHGYHVQTSNSASLAEREREQLRVLEQQRVGGVLWAPVDGPGGRADALRRRGIPVTLCATHDHIPSWPRYRVPMPRFFFGAAGAAGGADTIKPPRQY